MGTGGERREEEHTGSVTDEVRVVVIHETKRPIVYRQSYYGHMCSLSNKTKNKEERREGGRGKGEGRESNNKLKDIVCVKHPVSKPNTLPICH